MPWCCEALYERGLELITNYKKKMKNKLVKVIDKILLRKRALIETVWAEYDDVLQIVFQIEEKILHILLGLNRVYYSGFKWLDVVISRMSIKPSDLAYRLEEVYTLPPEEGAISIVKLVDETYALIEQHMPDIDVRWLRQVFHYERPSWEQKPPVQP